LFGHYRKNGKEIYLYNKTNDLIDIITPKILGEKLFKNFEEILKTKVELKTFS